MVIEFGGRNSRFCSYAGYKTNSATKELNTTNQNRKRAVEPILFIPTLVMGVLQATPADPAVYLTNNTRSVNAKFLHQICKIIKEGVDMLSVASFVKKILQS